MGRSRKRILQQPYVKFVRYNDFLTYLTHNEAKSVVAERFVTTLKDEIYEKKWRLMIASLIFSTLTS